MATMTRLCFGKSNIELVDQAIKRIGSVLGVVPYTLAFIPALHKGRGLLSPVRYLNFRLSHFAALLIGEVNEALRDNRHCLAAHLGEVCSIDSCTDEIRDQIATALVAGFEATAAIEWLLYWIFSNPDIIPELREEFYSADTGLNIDGLLLDSACKEALRLSPPVDFYPRQVIHNDGGRTYMVAACSLVMHRESDVFSDPDEFCAYRFKNHSFSNDKYSVYGGGQWRCPGEGLRQVAMKSFVAELVANYDITFAKLGKPKWCRKTIVLIPEKLKISKLRAVAKSPTSKLGHSR